MFDISEIANVIRLVKIVSFFSIYFKRQTGDFIFGRIYIVILFLDQPILRLEFYVLRFFWNELISMAHA